MSDTSSGSDARRSHPLAVRRLARNMPRRLNRPGFVRFGSSAVLTLALVAASPAAFAAGASLQSATTAQKKAAGKSFVEGMKALNANKYDDALKAFQDSYNSVASPNSHLMIARTLVKLGRLGEAYTEFGKTQKEARSDAKFDKKYKKAEKSAGNERDALRSKIALLTVQVTGAGSGATLTVAGHQIDQADWANPIPIEPGSVTVALQTADGKTTQKQVTATAGGTPTVQIAPTAATPAATTPPPPTETKAEASTSGINKRTLAYVAGGVGAAGLITFGVFGALDNSKYNSLKKDCPGGTCPANKKSEADAGKTYQTVANVGLVIGIVGLAGGAALYFLSTRDAKKDSGATAEDTPGVDVGLGFGSVNVRGSF